MMDMGIPNEKAELALSETGNVGVEVATEWLFSVPDHVLEKHLASEPNTPVEAAQQNPEDTRVLVPRRVPLQVLLHTCCYVALLLLHDTGCSGPVSATLCGPMLVHPVHVLASAACMNRAWGWQRQVSHHEQWPHGDSVRRPCYSKVKLAEVEATGVVSSSAAVWLHIMHVAPSL